jgi:hypothetical protein
LIFPCSILATNLLKLIEMFVANPKLASRGGLAVAVPGELKGLEYAWKTVSPYSHRNDTVATSIFDYGSNANIAYLVRKWQDQLVSFVR